MKLSDYWEVALLKKKPSFDQLRQLSLFTSSKRVYKSERRKQCGDSNRRGEETKGHWGRWRVENKVWDKLTWICSLYTTHVVFFSSFFYIFSVGSTCKSTCFIFGISNELLNIYQRSSNSVKACSQEPSMMAISSQGGEKTETVLLIPRVAVNFLLSRRENRRCPMDDTSSSSCHLWGQTDCQLVSRRLISQTLLCLLTVNVSRTQTGGSSRGDRLFNAEWFNIQPLKEQRTLVKKEHHISPFTFSSNINNINNKSFYL